MLSVHGADRPGIVGALTGVVARHGAEHHRPDHPAVRRPVRPGRRGARCPTTHAVVARAAAPAGHRRRARRRRPLRPLDDRRLVSEPSPTWQLPASAARHGAARRPGPAPGAVRAGRGRRPHRPAHVVAARRGPAGHPGRLAGLRRPGRPAGRGRLAGVQRRRVRPSQDPHRATARFVLCNADVLEASRRERGREGCMSVPDLTGDVKRARRLVVRGQLPVTGEGSTIDHRRLRGGRAAARDRPHGRRALPRPGRRSPRAPPAPDLSVVLDCLAPVAQPAEAGALKAFQYGFEPRRGHHRCTVVCTRARRSPATRHTA